MITTQVTKVKVEFSTLSKERLRYDCVQRERNTPKPVDQGTQRRARVTASFLIHHYLLQQAEEVPNLLSKRTSRALQVHFDSEEHCESILRRGRL